jgi:hypothetical protein
MNFFPVSQSIRIYQVVQFQVRQRRGKKFPLGKIERLFNLITKWPLKSDIFERFIVTVQKKSRKP